MPIIASSKDLVEYPLKLTGVKGLENDSLFFDRLTLGEKLVYSPKIYEPWRDHEEKEKEVGKISKNLVAELEAMRGEEISDELKGYYKNLPEATRRGLAIQVVNSRSPDIIATDSIKNLQTKIDDSVVIELFKKKLKGWSDAFYQSQEGLDIAFTDKIIDEASEDISPEKIMLPALVYLFQMSDMKVKGVDFFSGNTLPTKTAKKERLIKKN